jgi:hypothetical protein
MPIILTTQEAGIRRIAVQSQLGQIVRETLSKNPQDKSESTGVFAPISCMGNRKCFSLFSPHCSSPNKLYCYFKKKKKNSVSPASIPQCTSKAYLKLITSHAYFVL